MHTVLVVHQPLLSPNKDGTWTLMADWVVYVDKRRFVVPAGFLTDGASIPRFLWRLCGHPMQAPRLYLAILHDWLYSGGDACVGRAYADSVFRDGLVCFGITKVAAWIQWLALRLCGWTHWSKNCK